MEALKKGQALENIAAGWAKRKLGCKEIKMRELVRGKTAIRPWEVDVHGIRKFLLGSEHVWIECKVHRVKRKHVLKLKDAIDDVKEAYDDDIAEWEPDEAFIVSPAGFDIDALRLAKKHKIKCYLVEDRKFKEMKA